VSMLRRQPGERGRGRQKASDSNTDFADEGHRLHEPGIRRAANRVIN
jgi:hypothetical protein